MVSAAITRDLSDPAGALIVADQRMPQMSGIEMLERAHPQASTAKQLLLKPQRVLGYAAVQPTQIASSSLSRAHARGHTAVPGYLIARLALDQSLRGNGLGGGAVGPEVAGLRRRRLHRQWPRDRRRSDRRRSYRVLRGVRVRPHQGPSSRMVMKVSTAAAALERDRPPSP